MNPDIFFYWFMALLVFVIIAMAIRPILKIAIIALVFAFLAGLVAGPGIAVQIVERMAHGEGK